ncbi:putative sugar phosphate isomerase [Pseudolycoriella hygida]|uniref:Sugar phosphate isomerase n=1 Tax=Pseudolycoriella hygida TaxID=35572 RepID=A0A9Q0N6Y3_9DIPT|nr:putative sugar phosphate isomerase [Pseudolycoriella hygida]
MKTYDILIASDHSGYLLKGKIINYLLSKNITVLDQGTNNQSVVDYPDYSKKVVEGILEKVAPFGILICGTGIGMSIAANRTTGIRAALCADLFMVERARAHNDANILVLGTKIPDEKLAYEMIFGTEKNKDILIHFLNDILGYKQEEEIAEITFLKTIQDPEIAAYKQSIVDVLCKDKHGTQFIVEMQISKHKGFEKRAQFYAAKAYSQQIIKEDEDHKKMAVYAKLKGVIFLAIADFIMFPEKKEWKSSHRLLDTKTYANDLKDFSFIFMELAKFNKTIKELENIQAKWAYFFKHAHESTLEQMEHLIGRDIIIKKAFQAIDQASWSEEELRTYEKLVKTELDNLAKSQISPN